jgi:phosphoglucosamine mutase
LVNVFGTDGIRGRANDSLITPENMMKLAVSAITSYQASGHKSVNSRFTVVIGKDTRLSGYMLEPALTSGFVAAGGDVILLGPIPTPCVSLMTRSLRADLGVMISASHNPYYDNGIKFFNSDGFKISLEDELKISETFASYDSVKLAKTDAMGKARRLDDASGRYIEFVKNSFPKKLSLVGMKIVVDTAHGATYKIAPRVFWELGAEVIKIGNEPNGLNINDGCGATDTALLQKVVVDSKADVGIALDGDGDRLIAVDENGCVLDGDYITAGIATDWDESGLLQNRKVVSTNMSNMAFEEFLNGRGIELIRADIGDKYIIEKMLETGAKLGSEKSGHIIPIDYTSTGDGLIAALQILAYISKNELRASAIRSLYEPYPQLFKNIDKVVETDSQDVNNFVAMVERDILKGRGRVVIRKSGTEKMTRIMVEADSEDAINTAITEVERFVRSL